MSLSKLEACQKGENDSILDSLDRFLATTAVSDQKCYRAIRIRTQI